MLDEYFALQIDGDANLTALPLVLPGYTPSFNNLPSFLLRLVFKVGVCLHVGTAQEGA